MKHRGAQITQTGADIIRQLYKINRRQGTDMPRLVESVVRFANGEIGSHMCCSLCLLPIDQPWDHMDICKYREEEPLSKFLKNGKKVLQSTK